jgi:hypothetical protein
MIRTFLLPCILLCVLTLGASSAAQRAPVPDPEISSVPVISVLPINAPLINVPIIKGTLDGPRTEVFITPTESCNANDVPDAMARAFRDYTGTVHFSSASSQLFQFLGPTLETVQHSCQPAFESANDTDPADFNDQVWLDSFYTLDGKTIATLGHTEYHGWAIQGECHAGGNNQYGECEYDSDTYHISTDGGYSFTTPKPPGNFLAGVPYQYQIDRGPMGYSVDTNTIEFGGWYYAVATSWTWPPDCSAQTGPDPCLTSGGAPIRTKDVFDPTSWRSWDGTDFSVSFADPYPGPVPDPQAHVYVPVPYMAYVNAINVYQPANVVVATLWDYWDDTMGPPGMYLTTSTDLVHWTKPALVVTVNELLADDPVGPWLYAYFSLIDPTAPDLSFATLGDHPYLYYVRLNTNNSEERVLYRRKITLTTNQ